MDQARVRCPPGLRPARKSLAWLIQQAVTWLCTVVAAERERGDRAVRAVAHRCHGTRAYAARCTGRESSSVWRTPPAVTFS